MTTTGNFKLFLNGEEVTEQGIRDCKESMSITIDGLSVFYSFFPKIESNQEIMLRRSKEITDKLYKQGIRSLGSLMAETLKIQIEEEFEIEEIKDDVITNINRGEKEIIELLNKIPHKEGSKKWFKTIANSMSKEDLEIYRERCKNEIYPNGKRVCDLTNADFRMDYTAEKDISEIIIFTTLEKELLSEKQQGHLSTRHKKPSINSRAEELLKIVDNNTILNTVNLNINNMYLDEIMEETDRREKEAQNRLAKQLYNIDSTIYNNINVVEGVKETEGKLNYELDFNFIEQMAERMGQNKDKYELYNWQKPMDVEKLKQSLFRHIVEVMKGNYSDEGRELGHIESIALNSMMINYQLKNK